MLALLINDRSIRCSRISLGKYTEAYVDDMMIKTVQSINHVKDLREVFKVIRRYGMRLIPKNVSLELPQERTLHEIAM